MGSTISKISEEFDTYFEMCACLNLRPKDNDFTHRDDLLRLFNCRTTQDFFGKMKELGLYKHK